MDPAKERVPIRRPGGRAAGVVARVHQAARELLTEVGYEALQLPDVAVRAGVNKTTVYRRWPTKRDLVSDLLLELSDHDLPRADTGHLSDDLVALLKDVAELLRTPLMQAMMRASLEGTIDPDARQSFWAERMHRSSVIIERAIRRGELPDDADARSILEHAASPIYFRLLITGEPVTDDDIRLFAERAVEAARRA
ncbi:TetR/AcrR family transcriptional regulator [Nocardioides sp. NPDC057577]|uniref:TetR/AcrR family transcriptional regulator n=1 Tax=Nocardioides sp. NPDC057577 TaxID=3346171 RepID=UPI00366AF89D